MKIILIGILEKTKEIKKNLEKLNPESGIIL